jgi:hypothetical protein
MSLFRPKKEDYIIVDSPVGKQRALKSEVFDGFSPAMLGLGDVKKEAESTSAISAVFDLQGFTNFCKQIEPELSVPTFLSAFLDWIFASIKDETQKSKQTGSVLIYHELPFYAKFLGDGLLLVWSTKGMGAVAQHNLITSLHAICMTYRKTFLPKMKRKVVDPPDRLRCGIAKGTVLSVGDGNDFVGSSINLAARLQKLPGLTFAFAARGFDPEAVWDPDALKVWSLKVAAIRGIGDNELIYVRTEELAKLTEQDKPFYRNP